MILLDVFPVILGLLGSLDRVVLLFLLSFGFALHSKEDHLFLAHLLDSLASQDASDVALDDFG